MSEALRLYGLKAVVLAGASGIGEAIARTLVKHGAEVLALDNHASDLSRTYESVRGVTGKSINSDADDIGAEVVGAAQDAMGGIDIVVAYVEMPQLSPIKDGDDAALAKLLDARSAIYTSVAEATLPKLKKSPAGRFISIGLVRSAFAIDGERAYEKSRDTLARFSESLASRFGDSGISANYIQPGAIMTPESRKVFSAATDLRDYCIKRSAARRLAEPVDIAKVVLFLASDDAGFVNGTGVMVDGGRAVAN